MQSEISMFEDYIRATVKNKFTNTVPTEEDLRKIGTRVRVMADITDEEFEQVIKKLEAVFDIALGTGEVLEAEYEPWLKAKKKDIDFFYWQRYERYLAEDAHRSPRVIASINDVSDKVVDLAGDPTVDGTLHRRGLLLGDIQSGKTANYVAIMNKAADVGYKVVILLTGTVESLRRQTQERVDEGFIGRSSKAYLRPNGQTVKKGVGSKDARRFATGFTTEKSDFKTGVVQSMNASLKNMSNEPVVFVMKKNARTLQNLIDWLKKFNLNNSGQVDLPLLLIDDEADNASVNTRADDDPTTINKHIRNILALFTKSSYLAVTATPFANIFIMPDKNEDMLSDDLFPADYIYALDTPTNYIGSKEIFGDDANYSTALMTIDDAEGFFPYKHKITLKLTTLPPSLYQALRYFLLANVVRDIRGVEKSHRSMLINVSRFVKVQEQITDLINEWLYEVQRDVKNFCMLSENDACKNSVLRDLRDEWNNAANPFSKMGVSWFEVQQKYLLKAITPIEVRTINQRSASNLDYTEYSENGLRVIAVGGLSLSRGLTLEGLMVSYFHRNTQMYDTLMQMGRWFGYRDGYKDLFRIWMPDDSIGWYAHITQAAEELREDISKMNRSGATPKEFGLRVRAHPTTLIVTARNKMKHAERQKCWITLDGKFFETPRFRKDINSVRSNKKITDELICNILDQSGKPNGSGKQKLFWNDVNRDLIISYLRKYENHYLNMESDGEALGEYIKSNDNFKSWNVLVYSGPNHGSFEVRNLEVIPVDRPIQNKSNVLSVYGGKMRIGSLGTCKYGLSAEEMSEAEKNFKELKRETYVAKFGDKAEEKLNSINTPDRAYLIPGRKPILIIYYIKADPEKSSVNDMPKGFNFDEDLFVGYGIGFPEAAGSEPKYAIYYVNTVEQRKNFESNMDFLDEFEEDQIDDIDN